MNCRRALAGSAAAVLATLSLTSCGFDSQTEQIYNQSRGVDERSGSVDVLNALIVADSDGRGALVTTLVNNEEEPDELRGVAGAGDDAGLEVAPGAETEVPADGLLNLAESPVEVSGERIVPGNFVELTFSFDRAESVTLKVPVMSSDDPEYADVELPTPTESVSPSAEVTEAPAETPTETPSP